MSYIDGLFQASVAHLDIPKGQHAVAQLYLFIHYHLYSTVANLMRLRVAEALGCEHNAIDAASTAYELLTNPASATTNEAHLYYVDAFTTLLAMTRIFDAVHHELCEGLSVRRLGHATRPDRRGGASRAC